MRASLLELVMLFSPIEALADPCGPKDKLLNGLAAKYGERSFASGLSNSSFVKFVGNLRSRTWSVVVIKEKGVSCVVAAGENLEFESPLVALALSPARPARLP